MRFIAFFCLSVVLGFCTSCSMGERDIKWGSDVCTHCKMTLTDKRFGAELVSEKGKVLIFDDLACMVTYLKANPQNFRKFVVNYQQPGVIIGLEQAILFKSENLQSPMASSMAALLNSAENTALVEEMKGSIVLWNDLIKK